MLNKGIKGSDEFLNGRLQPERQGFGRAIEVLAARC